MTFYYINQGKYFIYCHLMHALMCTCDLMSFKISSHLSYLENWRVILLFIYKYIDRRIEGCIICAVQLISWVCMNLHIKNKRRLFICRCQSLTHHLYICLPAETPLEKERKWRKFDLESSRFGVVELLVWRALLASIQNLDRNCRTTSLPEQLPRKLRCNWGWWLLQRCLCQPAKVQYQLRCICVKTWNLLELVGNGIPSSPCLVRGGGYYKEHLIPLPVHFHVYVSTIQMMKRIE